MEECSFGNFVTDAMAAEMGVKIALINSGAIKGSFNEYKEANGKFVISKYNMKKAPCYTLAFVVSMAYFWPRKFKFVKILVATFLFMGHMGISIEYLMTVW